MVVSQMDFYWRKRSDIDRYKLNHFLYSYLKEEEKINKKKIKLDKANF